MNILGLFFVVVHVMVLSDITPPLRVVTATPRCKHEFDAVLGTVTPKDEHLTLVGFQDRRLCALKRCQFVLLSQKRFSVAYGS